MTEYTTSSEAIREYLSARERTVLWVRQHFEHDTEDQLLSPSTPPSQLDDSDAPSYGPSDSEESSHSLPPRMVLRWNDGRPDIPIAPNDTHRHPRPQSHSHSRRSVPSGPAPHRHGSAHGSVPRNPSGTAVPPMYLRHEQTLSYVTVPGQEVHTGGHSPPPASPEHIVVLPSPQEEDVPQAPIDVSASTSHASYYESTAHSRTPTARSAHPAPPGGPAYDVPVSEHPSQAHQNIISPSPRHGYNPSHVSHHTARSPPIAHSQSQPLPAQHTNMRYGDPAATTYRAQSQLPYAYSPPAIVYAPSAKHGSSRYAPPAIVYSPPSHSRSHFRGPAPSITYSQSAPLPHPHNPYYSHEGGTSIPQRPSHRGVPSQLSSTAVEEEAEEYEDAPDRNRSYRRSARRNHHRHPSASGRSRGRSTGVISVPRSPSRSQSRVGTPGLSEAGSQTSGSTYYILPTPGQKVQIIDPAAPSLYTATSATKSGHSPHSASSHKKPFFQRIFSIPKFASSVDSRASSSSRKLHRRHTVTTQAQRV